MQKKIAVLGTGANGSCVAADLTNAGLDVVLIDQWPAHIEAMRANGLHVTLRQDEIHAKVRAYHLCELASMRQVFDLVFLVTKAYDTRWHAELIKPYLKAGQFPDWAPERDDGRDHCRRGRPFPDAGLRARAVVVLLRARPDQAKHGSRPNLVRTRQLSSVHGWA